MIPRKITPAILGYIASLLPAASAWDAPAYPGFNLVWQAAFSSAVGQPPDGNWNIITGNLGINGELQTYTSSSSNVQCSGGQTLQIVPWRNASAPAGWTSGRIESQYTFTPAQDRVTMAEGQIRFGGNAPGNKQGLWSAFWMMGDVIRRAGSPGWPAAGEVDAMETINGQLVGYGTVHCDVFPGGVCNESTGIGGSIAFPDQGWHKWRVVWDRTSSDYQSQSITWYMDGIQFHQVAGSRIGNPRVWSTLAGQPLYFILNMAVGGLWPGNPNSGTLDGYGSMMEVAYVAHYST